ncbi:vitellogenin-2-like [Cottoperca gobio]|uniref:Vitellogenin-2-like n=1 Tax=Cottoperca gobio TaxID=56716 RepID=A0A6J2PLN7_COTGO|nr:vitellogenin-2-like [Cottoperca gobio]
MRVLVLALTVAFAAGYQANYTPEFCLGKNYVFRYEALVMGGLPEKGLARAGVKVKSKVVIRAESADTFTLKLVEPEIFEYSGIWPTDPFAPASKLTSILIAELTTTIKFEYANGVVGKVFSPENLSATVLNVHRGILNIFQLNIKKTKNVYELQELGAQGVCKTQYVISEDTKDERIMLTKTKDLNNCQERVIKDIGLAYTKRASECEASGKSIKGTSAFNYVMKKEATGVLILEATVTELIQFSPFNILNGAAQMESKQNLTFLEITKTPLESNNAKYIHRGSLRYEFGSELLQTPIQLLKIRNAEEQIVEILKHLVTFNVDRVHEDAPLKYIELIQLLRMIKLDEIEALWNKHKNNVQYRHWLLNAIPSIGSNASVRFIKKKLMADELNNMEAAQTLLISISTVTADLESIKLVEGLIDNEQVKNGSILREIVMLGYGTLLSKYCLENPTCPAELMKSMHERVVDAAAKGNIEELIICLKVMGNAAHPASLKPIMKLLPSFGSATADLPLRVYIEAVLATRNIAKREPKMIQEMAIQLFMDRDLHAELRMVAAIVMFETKLPMGLVTTLADAMLKEKNLQIGSFVYSYMKSMTRSTAPDFASVAAACSVALKILSPKYERLSYRYSRALYLDAYHNSWMMGAAASVFYVNDAATLLPRAIVAKARAYLAGAYADVLEVGVRAEGVQEALLKIGNVAEDDDRMTKMKRVMKALSEWRSHLSKQPLGSVYVKFFGQEVAFANIDKAIFDQVIELASAASIRNYGKKALNALLKGLNKHFAKPILVAEVRRIFPTAIGLPMELSFYTAAVATASVGFNTTVTPSLPSNFLASDLLKHNITMQAAITPSVSIHTYAVMGVNTAFIQAALVSRARIQTILPAKIEARMDMIDGNFNLQLLPVKNINKIASVIVDTYAVARNVEDLAAAKITQMIPSELIPQNSKSSISSKFSKITSFWASSMSASSEIISIDLTRKMSSNLQFKSFESKMCTEFRTFGIKACTEIQSRNALNFKRCLLYALVGNHGFLVHVSPAPGPVIEKIEIDVQVGKRALQKIIKVINMSEEEELVEDKNVLMKLKKILVPGLKNRTSSSSSSSSSSSGTTSSSSSHSSSSSNTSSQSSSESSSSKTVNGSKASKRVSSSSSSASSSHSSLRSSSRSSSSSSSSSRSSALFNQQLYKMKFIKNHIHQHAISAAHTDSKSSAHSFKAIYKKAKYLSKEVTPAVTILIRAMRADHKVQGYQIAAYYNNDTARLQIIFANLTETNHWRICADSVKLSDHKRMVKVSWGLNCNQYDTTVTAETGRVGEDPAISLKLVWNRLPKDMKYYAKKISEYMCPITKNYGLSLAKAKNVRKQINLSVAAASETTLNVMLKTPKMTIFKLGVTLPVSLPMRETAVELEQYQNKLSDRIIYMFNKAAAAECAMVNGTVTTFNNIKLNSNNMPHSCYHVLAQDCTKELKFIVLLKKEQTPEEHQINVKISNIDVDMHRKNKTIKLKVNGVELSMGSLPYSDSKGTIKISQEGEAIVLRAPCYGLQEVYFAENKLTVKIADWMRGQTCGLCGKADGEVRQEYSTPNQRLTKDAVSYAHSWVMGAKSCRDVSECYVKLESVKLEKQVNIHGQDSKCYSVEPVLRCLPGCIPVRTTPVTVGYHCLPVDANLNRSVGLSSIFEKSIDLRETTDAHLACRCTAQCA